MKLDDDWSILKLLVFMVKTIIEVGSCILIVSIQSLIQLAVAMVSHLAISMITSQIFGRIPPFIEEIIWEYYSI